MLCAHGRNGWAALTWRFNCLQFFKQHAKENNVKCVIFIPSCFPWFHRSALTPLWQDHNLSGSCCDVFLDLGGESGGEGLGLQLHWAVENKQERRLWNVRLPYAWLLNFASVLLDWIILSASASPVCVITVMRALVRDSLTMSSLYPYSDGAAVGMSCLLKWGRKCF